MSHEKVSIFKHQRDCPQVTSAQTVSDPSSPSDQLALAQLCVSSFKQCIRYTVRAHSIFPELLDLWTRRHADEPIHSLTCPAELNAGRGGSEMYLLACFAHDAYVNPHRWGLYPPGGLLWLRLPRTRSCGLSCDRLPFVDANSFYSGGPG